jgi:hypothetical protein
MMRESPSAPRASGTAMMVYSTCQFAEASAPHSDLISAKGRSRYVSSGAAEVSPLTRRIRLVKRPAASPL